MRELNLPCSEPRFPHPLLELRVGGIESVSKTARAHKTPHQGRNPVVLITLPPSLRGIGDVVSYDAGDKMLVVVQLPNPFLSQDVPEMS
jgi:hypothetical protein